MENTAMMRKSMTRLFSSLFTAGLAVLGLVSCATTGKSPKEDRGRMRVLYGGPNMVYQQRSPLILIDGEESNEEHLKKIDPNNVESFNVLKDSATVVKYGEKARGGVIEVKTKK